MKFTGRQWIEKGTHFLGIMNYILVVFLPLGMLAGQAGQDWVQAGASGLFSMRRLDLLVRSAGLALAVTLGANLLGTLAALFLWRWSISRPSLRWLILLLAPLPPYIHAMAWMALTDSLGLPTRGLALSIWVQIMAFMPLATALALVGLDSVENGLVEAARLAHTDFTTLKRVILPLASPAILTGCGLVFLLSLTDYSVPSLFQVNTYPLEIFSEFSASGSAGRAFLTSLPLLLLSGGVTLALVGRLRSVAESGSRGDTTHRARPGFHWPGWLTVLIGAAVAVWVAQVGAPLGVLLWQVGSWQKFSQSVGTAGSEIGFTLWTAGAAAILCLPLGLALGGEMARRGRRGWLAWFLALAPLALPAPLVGIGLIAVWNRDLPLAVYGSAWMPVLAMLARFSALAALLALAQQRRTDARLFEAAAVFQPDLLKTWLRVRLPLLAPGLLAAAGVVFILSAGELGATLIVAPPGQATLTLRIYNYLHYGASDTVAGLCLLVALASLGLGSVAAVLFGRIKNEANPL